MKQQSATTVATKNEEIRCSIMNSGFFCLHL